MVHPFTSVIIPAAGSGSRMKSDKNKQFLELAGKPVIIHTMLAFDQCFCVDEMIIVTKKSELEMFSELIKKFKIEKPIKFVIGGVTRQESVHHGIMAVNENAKYVAIHDGARPFIDNDDLLRIFEAVYKLKAVVAAVPSKDTIKRVNEKGEVIETLKRSELWNIQTPQVFERRILEKAYNHAVEVKYQGTDDASLVEWLGEKVHVVMGSYNNIKITTPEDLVIGEMILKK